MFTSYEINSEFTKTKADRNYFANIDFEDIYSEIKAPFQLIEQPLLLTYRILDSRVKNLTLDILLKIFISTNHNYELFTQHPIHGYASDDGSFNLEWIFKELRIGFTIDINFEKSSWYFVHKNGDSSFGQLSSDDLLGRIQNLTNKAINTFKS